MKFNKIISKLPLLLVLHVFILCPSYGQSPTESSYTPNQALIAFEQGVPYDSIKNYVENELNSILLDVSPWSNVALIETHDSTTVPDIEEIIRNDDGADTGASDDADIVIGSGGNSKIELEGISPAQGALQPSMFPHNCSSTVSTIPHSRTRIKIAIIDTGIDFVSTDVAPHYRFNHNEFYNHFDDDLGYNFLDNSVFPLDDHGHGTALKGIIDALAPKTNIQWKAYKVFDHTGNGKLFDVILGLDQAVLDGSNIINCSFRFNMRPSMARVFEHVFKLIDRKNILVSAGIGNEGQHVLPNDNGADTPRPYPAAFNFNCILSVAASDCMNDLTYYTNYGRITADIAALGDDIQSFGLGGNYQTLVSGSSFSTAFITGIAAQLAGNQTSFNAEEIKCAILNSATVNDLPVSSAGVIHADNAYITLQSGCSLFNTDDFSMQSDTRLDKSSSVLTYPDQVILYPNPARRALNVNINTDKEEDISASILLASGRGVYSTTFKLLRGNNTISLDLDKLTPGIYYLKLSSVTEKRIQKFVIN